MKPPPLIACVGLLVAGLSACGNPGSTLSGPVPSPSNGAGDKCRGTTGGQVVIYSTRGLEYWYDNVLTNFEQDCRVKVFYIGVSSELVLERLESEKAAPLADIAVIHAPFMATAAGEGLLRAGRLDEAAVVPTDRCDSARRWCTVVDDVSSWVANPTVAGQSPAHWDDILAPGLRGGVLEQAADQSIHGFATQVLLSRTRGVERAYAFMASLESSVYRHYASTDLQSRDLSLVHGAVANGNLQEHENDVDQFYNLSVFFPADGDTRSTLSIPYAAGLVAGGHNSGNARALLRYMWSRETQLLVGDAYGIPARPDVTPGDVRSQRLAGALKGVSVLRVDWALILRDTRLGATWRKLRATLAAPPSPAPAPVPAPSG